MDAFDWQGEYVRLNTGTGTAEARPLIGITGNYSQETCTLAEGYYQSVLRAGGIPVVVPPSQPDGTLAELLDRLDGIVFSGGGDPNPLLFGEEPVRELHSITPERDMQELLLVRMAYDRQIPMLGICRGIQMMNAALGGTLWQDINTQMEGVRIKHSQDQDRRYPSHTVRVEKESLLYKLMGVETLPVNSFHHQACKGVAPCLRVSATAADGVIEAVESCEYKSVLGVQWHPETYILRGSVEMLPVFEWLVGEAAEFKAAKRVHGRVLTLDSHQDTPMFFPQGIDFGSRDPKVLVDLHKMREGHLDAAVMVAYLEQGERDEVSLENATAKANRILTQIEEMVSRHCTAVDIAYTPDDLWRLKAQGKRAIMLGIENGYAVGKDIRNVEAFRRRGVVYMTLCHNGDNDICTSHTDPLPRPLPLYGEGGAVRMASPHRGGDTPKGERGSAGVSDFGAQVIREMNRVGMMVDLSHASEQSFYDALEISATPIVCSHSSARALCNHSRNLTDDQLRALARSGGVAQVTFYHGFLKEQGQASILDAVEHLNHMVNVMGVEHVGIGTDFDGDGGVPGVASASELINFTRRLLRERYSEEQIQMIWGGNFLRVMKECQDWTIGQCTI
ncbi:MAG: gamma-glutamyl-gamma-aminobutyrate hydrolase family protein [Bacteroidaceae bacterium]|nr:gamma-glutamyl-gamma-aminobutyrate hydrolase family protein [Bacteroidaceae bacterium]